MKLWLREFSPSANSIHFDKEIEVRSQAEWMGLINRHEVLCSILWPEPPLFPLQGPHYHGRHHPHEKNYHNNCQRNLSYRAGCRRLAEKLNPLISGKKCLVYAPLRGALPIWKSIRQFIPGSDCETYYAVTSSFVFYPETFRIFNKKGRPASGRHTNILELRSRIKPILANFDFLIYVDEIVSGNMMKGHLQDMLDLNFDKQIRIIAVGLADQFGERSLNKRQAIESFKSQGWIYDFLWEGCASLITEDNRYLLGMHYVDYHLGPHAVPMLVGTDTQQLFSPLEKIAFDRDISGDAV
jgi:hypothetical protein